MRPTTLARKQQTQRCVRLLLALMAQERGAEAVRIPRSLLEEIVVLLGSDPHRRCLLCGTQLVGARKRTYCSDACRCKAMRIRQGWTPRRQSKTQMPELWEAMGTLLTRQLATR